MNLLQRRIDAGYKTSDELSKATGVSSSYIRQLESGQRINPSRTVLYKLEKALGKLDSSHQRIDKVNKVLFFTVGLLLAIYVFICYTLII